MGLFTKPEVIILKESSDAKTYLGSLEKLLENSNGDIQKQIQKEIAITKAGIIGEDNILFELKNSNMDMVVLHDIYIETKDGLGAQIDFIVVTSKLTFLIECKNLFGNIEIDSKGNFIRTIEYGKKKYKEGIYSPITQNERHMAVLKECRAEGQNLIIGAALRGLFNKQFRSLVVMANPKTIVNDRYARKEIKEMVLRADQVINVIRKLNSESNELSSSKRDMLVIAERMLSRNVEERKDYCKKYKEWIEQIKLSMSVSATKTETQEKDKVIQKNKEKNTSLIQEDKKICSKCGCEMILRTAQKGPKAGQKFYGCSNFPKCRNVESVE